jgi:hypothetical protein
MNRLTMLALALVLTVNGDIRLLRVRTEAVGK